MNGHKLSLEVRCKFADLETQVFQLPFILVCICLTFCRFLKVYTPGIPGRDLNTHKTETGNPFADIFKCIERGCIAHELRKKYCRSFYCFHC